MEFDVEPIIKDGNGTVLLQDCLCMLAALIAAAAMLQDVGQATSPNFTDFVPTETKMLEVAAMAKAICEPGGPSIANLVFVKTKPFKIPAVLEAVRKVTSASIADLVLHEIHP